MKRAIAGPIGFLAAFAAQNGCGLALEVTRSLDMNAPPAAVWAIVGDFCAIEKWHPLVERCSVSNSSDDEGKPVAIRRLVTAGGLGTIVEVQTMRDETAMSYSYAYVEGPLPVSAYNATIAVHANGSNSTVVWTATFDAAGMSDAEAKADIEGVYDQGLTGIAKEAGR
ncbi:SRPBCC family protein [Methylobacterium sp. J-068]|jgi:carbon monoxide dehydrogenase subunit G|uniref:SRPBCC family protein n=1 Tax=Methylobacterium sp. J-068 TaxID=2836649 RepID=UPI001FBA32C2|nr:SRPBCC family protein [Methylobacterium sp. J-068]MCJ2035623.1 SRPBCC family protein [Methylobacterium sp. J-068]